MRLDWSALGTAIAARKLADWVLTSRRRQRLTLHLLAGRERWCADEGEALRVLVRRDLAAGRGTGVVEVHAQTGDAGAVLDHAVALAEASVGPPWTTPPAAAPARVALLDEALVGSLEDALAGLRRALADASAAVGLELAERHAMSKTRPLLGLERREHGVVAVRAGDSLERNAPGPSGQIDLVLGRDGEGAKVEVQGLRGRCVHRTRVVPSARETDSNSSDVRTDREGGPTGRPAAGAPAPAAPDPSAARSPKAAAPDAARA